MLSCVYLHILFSVQSIVFLPYPFIWHRSSEKKKMVVSLWTKGDLLERDLRHCSCPVPERAIVIVTCGPQTAILLHHHGETIAYGHGLNPSHRLLERVPVGGSPCSPCYTPGSLHRPRVQHSCQSLMPCGWEPRRGSGHPVKTQDLRVVLRKSVRQCTNAPTCYKITELCP